MSEFWTNWNNYASHVNFRVGHGDKEQCQIQEAFPAQLHNAVLIAMSAYLTKKERSVLRLRLGLEDGMFWTYDAVGHQFGCTAERIRQIVRKAIRKLSHSDSLFIIREAVECDEEEIIQRLAA